MLLPGGHLELLREISPEVLNPAAEFGQVS